MATYYVITAPHDYESSFYEFDTLDAALEQYREMMTYTTPILVQQLDVTLVATDLDGNQASIKRDAE